MARHEIGAMPWFIRDRDVHIVLVTSRSRQRWILPKGQPEPDLKDPETAAVEAYEEAGIRGRIKRKHSHSAKRPGGPTLKVYPMKVERLLHDWPESHERRRRVVRWDRAVELLEDEAMQQCVLRLAKDIRPH